MSNKKDDIIDVEVIDVEDAGVVDDTEVVEPEVVSHNNRQYSDSSQGNPYAKSYQYNMSQRRGCGCLSPGCLIPLLLVVIFVPSLLKWSFYLILGLVVFVIIGFFVLRYFAKRRTR